MFVLLSSLFSSLLDLSIFNAFKFEFLDSLQRYSALSKQRLDRAILTFFQHFRKSYVGDQAMHSSKVILQRLCLRYTIFVCLFLLRALFLLHTLTDIVHLLQQLYNKLSELLGLHDHLLLLDFFVRKIATNLKCYTEVKSLPYSYI